MGKVVYMTEEGLRKLREELDQLTTFERPKISRQIAEARDKGDLSENAEYDAAKEAQGMLELRISKLQEMVANARIIDESKLDRHSVQILCTVKLKNLKTGAIMNYTLVAENEANVKEGRIAISTPIAKGLIGKKVGERAEITVPSGQLSLEILEINH
ncbi:MAG TPA: transcription elongation factor GreA [Bacteroidales bacterium]|nr:transcription elongation factor GreA [Bacteroidales bacterium]